MLKFIFDNVIRENKVFKYSHSKKLNARINRIVTNLQTLLFIPEDILIKQGEDSLFLFFLSKGQAKVMVRDHRQRESQCGMLVSGAIFGVNN